MVSLLLNTHQTYDYFSCSKLHWFTDCDLFEHVCTVVSLIVLIRHTCLPIEIQGNRSQFLFGHPSVTTANDDLLFEALMLVNLCVHLRTHVHVHIQSQGFLSSSSGS